MTQEQMIKAIREKAKQLVALTDDPHPGLVTWHQAVGRLLVDLAAFAPERLVPAENRCIPEDPKR